MSSMSNPTMPARRRPTNKPMAKSTRSIRPSPPALARLFIYSFFIYSCCTSA
jgi:hypothetical protein